jgi:hypothetical protein
LENFQLASFKKRAALLVLRGHGFAPSTGSLVERRRHREQRHRNDQRQPSSGPKNDKDAQQ